MTSSHAHPSQTKLFTEIGIQRGKGGFVRGFPRVRLKKLAEEESARNQPFIEKAVPAFWFWLSSLRQHLNKVR